MYSVICTLQKYRLQKSTGLKVKISWHRQSWQAKHDINNTSPTFAPRLTGQSQLSWRNQRVSSEKSFAGIARLTLAKYVTPVSWDTQDISKKIGVPQSHKWCFYPDLEVSEEQFRKKYICRITKLVSGQIIIRDSCFSSRTHVDSVLWHLGVSLFRIVSRTQPLHCSFGKKLARLPMYLGQTHYHIREHAGSNVWSWRTL